MKRTILSILALIVTISAMAGNVSSSKAKEIASSVFNTTRSGGVSLVWDGSDGSTKSSDPAFYVFNYDGGGFVVISADDRTKPILAYSETGSFKVEGMPSNIRGWFGNYTRQVEFLRSSDIGQSPEIAKLWKDGEKAPKVLQDLNTAEWNQGAPFNNKCPKVDGKQSITGCVATSTAIIMYHHKWPKSQSGTLPSYTYKTDKGNTVTQKGHELAQSYNWSAMLPSYDGSSTSQANSSVATLMFDLGVMLQSTFNETGTGAYSENIGPLLVRYMNYDSSAVILYRDEMSSKAWSARMKEEIDNNRPVSYSGSGKDGGHQFVLDGYGSDDYFKINWGWGGFDNGLFLLEVLDCDGSNFNIGCSAFVNIKPKEESGKPVERIRYYMDGNGSGGLVFMSGSLTKGSTAKIAVLNVCNLNGGYIEDANMGSVIAKYAMCLLDKNDKVKEVYEESDYFDLESYYGFSDTATVTIGCDTELGDKLMLCYKSTGEWTPVEMDYSMYNSEYGSTILNISDAIAVYDFPEIKVDMEGYSAGDMLDLRLTNCLYIPSITWYFDGKKVENGVNSIRLTSGKHTVVAEVAFYKNTTYTGTKIRTDKLVRVINVE